MKKLIAFVLALTLLSSFCACSSDENPDTSTKTDATTTDVETSDISVPGLDLIEQITVDPNAPVDIYLRVYDFSGTDTKTYVENLQKENPEGKYQYYNEDFYIQTITEKERTEMLDKLNDVNELSATMFESYPDVFISAEVSDDLSQITYKVNGDAYRNSMAGFVVLLGGAITLDQIQAYNLLPLEDRQVTILIIDETGAVIYDSSEDS